MVVTDSFFAVAQNFPDLGSPVFLLKNMTAPGPSLEKSKAVWIFLACAPPRSRTF